MQSIKQLSAGLILALLVAAAAFGLAEMAWARDEALSPATLAIVLGILVGNTAYRLLERRCATGVGFCKHWILRAGIVLFGLRLTFADIGHVGTRGVLIDALVLASTMAWSWWLGTRCFKLDRRSALLIGAGSSICGAAAVMAAGPVLRARADEMSVAVCTVVVFGTLAMFSYPMLYHAALAAHLPGVSPRTYGLMAGSTIHEVAQVVAAGRAVGEDAANIAVITKMVRVMMLAPVLLLLSVDRPSPHSRPANVADPSRRFGVGIPWFAFAFIAVTALHSWVRLPAPWSAAAITVDNLLLTTAMAALGLTTRVSALRGAGLKPLALAASLFVWLLGGGLLINAAIGV